MEKESEKKLGNIKWFNEKFGYGFIKRTGKKDTFLHHSRIVSKWDNKIETGCFVRFNISEDSQGREFATDVELLAEEKNAE